jgi:hypothetical protein
VKFSAEEMACEPPAEVNFKKGLTFRGLKQWKQFLSFKRGYVKLSPDLQKKFKDSAAVNEALRKLANTREVTTRKSA